MNKIIQDYKKRDVDFSLIHNESDEVYFKLIDLMAICDGQAFLDIGGGYGSFLYKLLNRIPDTRMKYYLWDSNKPFIAKAIRDYEKCANKDSNIDVSFVHNNGLNISEDHSKFDVILCKMFIHEIPKSDKEKVFNNIYSLLKPGGRVYFWKPDLSEKNYDFYRRVIAKKDQLADFENLAKERDFLLNTELEAHLANSGFQEISKLFDFDYILHTDRRLVSEFRNETKKLLEWNDFVKKEHERLNQTGFTPIKEDKSINRITIDFKRIIYSALR
ncbi:class I SAM-dependent methyltransferase [Algoriphagus sp. SE2]|uniref:class I SAM-dependent methyltransferase n=1 Tax=Algoriphagus sp. SE2 TaxID=3141536 RepID=UPI0031CD4C9C